MNPYTQNSRGIGPAEMEEAIRAGVQSRVGAKLACHVLDVLEAVLESGRKHAFCRVASTCERPLPFKGLSHD